MAKPGSVAAAHARVAQVSGGVTASSPSYRLITTTGQSPGGNGNSSSSSYVSRSGLVGATQGQ
jgi:hypothetical protein